MALIAMILTEERRAKDRFPTPEVARRAIARVRLEAAKEQANGYTCETLPPMNTLIPRRKENNYSEKDDCPRNVRKY